MTQCRCLSLHLNLGHRQEGPPSVFGFFFPLLPLSHILQLIYQTTKKFLFSFPPTTSLIFGLFRIQVGKKQGYFAGPFQMTKEPRLWDPDLNHRDRYPVASQVQILCPGFHGPLRQPPGKPASGSPTTPSPNPQLLKRQATQWMRSLWESTS